jgi:hypothetical protein
MVDRRGACHHPDGSMRFLRSALRVFEAEFELHSRGGCSATSATPVLPVTAWPAASRLPDGRSEA